MDLWYIYTLNTLKRLKGHINTLQGHIKQCNTLQVILYTLTGDTHTHTHTRKEDTTHIKRIMSSIGINKTLYD